MRVPRLEFAGVLHDEYPILVRHHGEHRRQQGGLAGPCSARHQERQPALHDPPQPTGSLGRQGTARHQLRQAEAALAGNPDRDARAAWCDGRDHRVQPGAVGQPGVHIGRGVVQAPPGQGRQPLGQPAHGHLVGEADVGPFQPVAAVHPDRAWPVHQHVGDVIVVQQSLQRPGAG